MLLLWLMLITPGLAVVYALLLRPMLHRIPAFAEFYAQADGFWAKAWAICGKSVTMLWGYLLGGIGSSVALVGPVASALGDPEIKEQVTTALQGNPKILGYVLIVISAVTIMSRLRSLMARDS
ncbi:hypothetical protein BF49_7143 [Bradyrhizobium sp.]|uniref:hypothetical protein n=1 Tax=Bradyrhizobium sp. TaxID=376 RepID=UPI0007C1EA1A|nr:hypothetical protein [Bradyrhizobium sp.]CUT12553.1 hypothetical protein BF49_3633 [Bradyrhizobium sp.]CUT16063.1 hypothetical protein BF49_7143 [Bradyrhizobium sp.]